MQVHKVGRKVTIFTRNGHRLDGPLADPRCRIGRPAKLCHRRRARRDRRKPHRRLWQASAHGEQAPRKVALPSGRSIFSQRTILFTTSRNTMYRLLGAILLLTGIGIFYLAVSTDRPAQNEPEALRGRFRIAPCVPRPSPRLEGRGVQFQTLHLRLSQRTPCRDFAARTALPTARDTAPPHQIHVHDPRPAARTQTCRLL